MEIAKNTKIVCFVLFSLLIFLGGIKIGLAQDNLTGETVATVEIYNGKIIFQEKNNFKISFELYNAEKVQPAVKYAAILLNDEGYIVERKIYNEIVSLNSGQKITKEINFTASDHLKGEFNLVLSSETPQGLPLAIYQLGDVILEGIGKDLSINRLSSFLAFQEGESLNKFNLADGISLGEKIWFSAEVLNGSGSDVFFYPQIEIFSRSAFGEKALSFKTPSFKIKKGEKIKIDIPFQQIEKPGSYEFELRFLDLEEKPVSNLFVGKFFIKGENASFYNLRLDKDYYQKGESARIYFNWLGEIKEEGSIAAFQILNDKEDVCVFGEKNLAETKKAYGNEIELVMEKNCRDPKVVAQIKNSSGITLSSSEFNIKSESVPDKSNENLIILSLAIILFLLIVLIFILNKKRLNYLAAVLFLFSLSLVFGVGKVDAVTSIRQNITVVHDLIPSLVDMGSSQNLTGYVDSCTNTNTGLYVGCIVSWEGYQIQFSTITGWDASRAFKDKTIITEGYNIPSSFYLSSTNTAPSVSGNLSTLYYTAYIPPHLRAWGGQHSGYFCANETYCASASGNSTVFDNIPWNTPITMSWRADWFDSDDPQINPGLCPSFGCACSLSGDWLKDSELNIGSYSVGNLTASRTYAIECRHDGISTPAYESITLNPTAPPPTAPVLNNPSNITPSSMTLSWNNVSGETRYELQRKMTAGGIYETIAGNIAAETVSYNDTGLSSNANYFYQVRACNSTGCSNWSNEVNATTLQSFDFSLSNSGNISVVKNPIFTQTGSNTITATLLGGSPQPVSFSVSGLPSGVTGSFGSSSCSPTCSTSFTASVSSSANPGTYSITVTGTGGGLSRMTSFNLIIEPPPSADIKANGSDGPITIAYNSSVTISWTSSGVSSCAVSYPGNSNWASGASGSQSTGALTSSRIYTLTCDYSGGTITDEVAVNVSEPPPNAPSNLSATAVSTSQINLSWTNNSNNESGFKIERSTSGGSFLQIATTGAGAASYQNTGLSAGTSYSYRVRAYNDSGDSAYSNTASAVTIPAAPTNVSVSPVAGNCAALNISWNASAGATEYYVMRSGSLTGAYIYIDATSNTFYQNAGLAGGTTYYYKIVAHNASGNSTDSAAASGTTGLCAPLAPANVSATANSCSGILVSWNASAGATGYSVFRSLNGTSGWVDVGTVNSPSASFQNNSLAANTAYYYFVVAFNASGNSPNSNIASATTPGCAGFTLSDSPAIIYGPQSGASQSATITVNPLNGFNSPVTFSIVSGLPVAASGFPATYTFSNPTVTPPILTTTGLTINMGAGTLPGTYSIVVRGTSGSITSDTTVILEVVDLSVDLKAAINWASGNWTDLLNGNSPLNDIDFQAEATGSASGTINYKLDCTNNGTWEVEINGSSDNPRLFVDACDYSLVGVYTARVMVERSVAIPAYDTVTINVTNAPTFSLSASPSTIKAPQNGSSQDSTITIASQNGFNSQVNLSITSGMPAGASYSITPMTSATPPANGSITRTFSVTANGVPPGFYLLNLQGVSGSITQNVAITLVVVSLNVDLDVSINSASGVWDDFITGANPLNDVDFRVTVGGTAAGTINYKLDCTNDGVWEREVNNTFVNPYEFLDACSYSTALPSQTFTARVMVQRDVANWDYDTVQITVTNQADFNISASKSIIYSPRTGVSESAGISINPINGFNSSVTLSISSTGNNLPAGSNANFSINPISQGSISSLSFSVVAGTPVGIYSFNLKGISGSLTHEIPMTLEVVDLNVDLMAAINGGATGIWFAALIGDIPFNDIDFRATVSGTAQGTINFKLDCDGDGILEAGEPNLTGVSLDANNQYTIIDACDYASAGVFNPRVTIERSAAIPATDTVQITAQDPALPTLSCNLSANPASGTPPLNVAFSADVSGTQTGTMNYSFWPNCNSACTTVSSCAGNCGGAPVPPKLDGTSVDPYNFNYSYDTSGTKYARMIVERGSLSSACATQVNVTNDQAPIAAAKISKDGVNYSESITVVKGVATNIYFSGSESSDPDGWTHATYGVSASGRCEWNSNLDQNTGQNFDFRIDHTNYDPPTSSGCYVSAVSHTFDDVGTHTYDVLRIKDNQLLASNIDTVTVVVEEPVAAPVIDFSVSPSSIQPNQSATLIWTVTPVSSTCFASASPANPNWTGSITPLSDSRSTGNLATQQLHSFTLACTGPGGNSSKTVSVNVSSFPGVTLTCNPSSVWLGVGEQQQFSAYFDNDGSGGPNPPINVSASATWQSFSPSVATVDSAGLATAVSEGIAQIQATRWGISCPNVSITVSNTEPPLPPPPTNQAPTVSGVSETQPDYCDIKNASATLVWNFSDSDGDSQLAYRAQVDNNSDFSSPAKDTNKVISASDSYYTGSSGLNYNTTYYWRVMVWDEHDVASAWSASRSFATPNHAYPTADFSWAPAGAAPDQQVFFTDTSSAASGYSISSRSWTFEDGTPGVATRANPVVKFHDPGSKTVDLSVSDGSFTCSVSKEVNIQVPLPGWKETAPRPQ